MAAVKGGDEAKQLRWTKPMDTCLIECLVDEAKQGHKVDKSYKKSSFIRAAKEVSEKCNVNCSVLNVDNRMNTIRTKFRILKKLESNNSGMSWDNYEKMWMCSEQVYNDYILAHLKAEPFLNKAIFMYDELHIICGDDQATGSFAKSSTDDILETDEVYDLGSDDNPLQTDDTQVNNNSMPSSPPHPPVVRKHGNGNGNGKRVRSIEEFGENMEKLAGAVEGMAHAIKSTNNQEYTTSSLYSEVMKVEGFDEVTLEDAFDYLNENDKVARSFLVKGTAGRLRWLQKYREGLIN
ncbi:hypothetical protein OROHE_018433 [Orobanche hederae]